MLRSFVKRVVVVNDGIVVEATLKLKKKEGISECQK
jgi:hypothetical protein